VYFNPTISLFFYVVHEGVNTFNRSSTENNFTTVWPPTFEEVVSQANTRRIFDQDRYEPPYSECGFPHHLLVPKGTPEGMTFDLLAFITDAKEDWSGSEIKDDKYNAPFIICGGYDGTSASYPDDKPMGYPFDRKIFSLEADTYSPPKYLEDYVSLIPNMQATQVRALFPN